MTEVTDRNRLIQWLFNPFRFIAGTKALLAGLVIILASSFIGSLSNTHFDGVIDVHTGIEAQMQLFLAEGIINWVCMVISLYLLGLIMSRSSFRIIDVAGTQALARWPYLITAIAMLPDANLRVFEYLISKLTKSEQVATVDPIDVLIFGFAMIVTILMTVWTVALMYRGYAVSCNIKGGKAVVTFIVGLVAAEALSKLALSLLIYFPA